MYALLYLLWGNGSTFVNKRWNIEGEWALHQEWVGCAFLTVKYTGKVEEIDHLSGRYFIKGLPPG